MSGREVRSGLFALPVPEQRRVTPSVKVSR